MNGSSLHRGTPLAPTFFVIGQPRAGTTSLHHYLGQHPSLCMSLVKEPNHFLGNDWPAGRVEDPKDYAELFVGKPPATQAGEASPEYLYSAHARERIRCEVPGARALVVLRHPVERAFSEWVYLRVRGIDPAATFEEAFAQERAGKRIGAPRHLLPWRSGCIADDLRAWSEALGAERLHVIHFDDLVRDTEAIVRTAWRFLGVDADAALDTSAQHNPAWQWRAGWLAAWLGHGARRRRAMERVLGSRAVGALAASRLVRRRPRLLPATRRRLAPLFLEDAREASRWAGDDLAARWGLTDPESDPT